VRCSRRTNSLHGYRDTLRALYLLYLDSRQIDKAEPYLDRYVALQEALVRQNADSPDEQVELAKALLSRGDWCEATGKRSAALDWYRQTVDALEPVVRQYPDRTADSELQATTQTKIGWVHYQLGQLPQAEKELARSVQVHEQLARKHPFMPAHRIWLAQARDVLAVVYRMQNRLPDAEAARLQALAEVKPVADEFPDRSDFRMNLAERYRKIGIFYQRTGKPDKSEEHYRNAVGLYDDLCRRHPENLEITAAAMGVRSAFANLLRTLDRMEESIRYYDQNIPRLEEALAKQPKDASTRHSLFVARLGRGLSLMKLERRDEAMEEWRHVIRLTDVQPELMMRMYRPMPLAYLGEHARATTEMEALLAGQKLEPTVLYDFACAYGTSSQFVADDAGLAETEKQALAERYAARAEELLARAHAAGYFAAPHRGVKSLQRWEFDPLRPRPSFQRLVAELDPKSPNGPPTGR
jgi:tetratricopeptide (TPR) repeat protein